MADIRPDSTSTSKDWDKWGPGWWGWKDDDDWSRPQWKPEWTSSPKHTKSSKHAKSWGKSGKSGRKRSWASWSSDSGDVHDWSISKSSSSSVDGWGMSISSQDWSSSWNSTAWPDHWQRPGKSGKSGFDKWGWGKSGKSGSAWTHNQWSSSGKSGKSGSDWETNWETKWETTFGFKPKANKGASEDSPGKELTYDDDTFPSWHNSDGWSSSSSGKSGKSGGKFGWQGDEWVESGWNSRSSASTDEYDDDVISADDDGVSSLPVSPPSSPPPPPVPVDNDTSQPTLMPTPPFADDTNMNLSPSSPCIICPNGITVDENTQPFIDDGDTASCKELVDVTAEVLNEGDESCEGSKMMEAYCCPDAQDPYWIYTNNGNEMTCVYSSTEPEPEDVVSTDWIHDTKEECCVYVYDLGGDPSTVSGCSEFAPSAQRTN